MLTDPRDAVLFAQSPAVMVPRYGAFEPLTKSGHRYLIASDGVWLEVCRPWLYATAQVAVADVPMPFGQVEETADYRIRPQDLKNLQARFLRDAIKAMPNEFAAWGVYDSLTGELDYHPLVAIDAGPSGITFHRPTLGLNEHLAIDIHSHGTMGAFFSPTDDEDDRHEVKLAVVVGKLDSGAPWWRSRLCLQGVFLTQDADEEIPV